MVSEPYLFFTTSPYLPESAVVTPVTVKKAVLPASNLRLQWSSESRDFSFFSQEISGVGSPHTVQVRLSVCKTGFIRGKERYQI